ncbi:UNVERIFIED_CONTAM: hypothetical protein PYX00_004201 [Menopon gallinae]|uniref:Uncharacterized protein n=1 Tax=Menopon gallinae TaxID=328185 RepID=A0AAW2I5E6_9NEOP
MKEEKRSDPPEDGETQQNEESEAEEHPGEDREKGTDLRLGKEGADDVQSDVSERSELLNVDEESNQSCEQYEKQYNVSPVDLTNRNLELDRNRLKLNSLLLRNRTIFSTDFLTNGREGINFFDGARFQLKEDGYANGRLTAPGFFDRRLDKVSDRLRDGFFKIEDVRHFGSEKIFIPDGKVEEARSESVNSNLSISSGDANFRRQDDKGKPFPGSGDKMPSGFMSFPRFSYSPDRKSSSPDGGEQGQPRRNLAFSVENILDPNKFTGNGPHKIGNGATGLAALVSGQRIPVSLENMVSPVGCCWRPQIQDGAESDRDDNSGQC